MKSISYKAFISYSHQDESWAKWLHKALESYKVPPSLVREMSQSGEAPGKLYPVFRDRDELSSSADLEANVQDALKHSESLIVICSPSSAKSRWVNEEIRLFRSLGRGERIFCMIVDGDPQAPTLDEACFPPALLESGVGEVHEPLAADARNWADGKLLAKLKLISGILGIRLDDLRQREQKRKIRLRAIYAVLGVIALALIMSAIVSQIDERARREQAEILVKQIVEISEGLNSVVNLETLQIIGERLQSYLNTLDPGDLTPESNKQIALVLRQLGEVSRLQGKPDEALTALTESREIISRLSRENPEVNDYLYELGNAEFYVGNFLMEQGDYRLAGQAFQRYAESAAELVRREPENSDWIMELSYTHTNQGAFQNLSGTGNTTVALEHADAAIALVESAIELAPDNDGYKAHYATTLAWAADTHLRVCDLGEALGLRIKTEQLAMSSLANQPGDYSRKKRHAYALTGVATVQLLVGMSEPALENMRSARDILNDLAGVDRENLDYRWGTLGLDVYIFDLIGETGDMETAIQSAAALQNSILELMSLSETEYSRGESQYIEYLLSYSELLWRKGDYKDARAALAKSIARLTAVLSANNKDLKSREYLAKARFLWWEQHGADLLGSRPELESYLIQESQEKQSCTGADLTARIAIIEGDRNLAQERVNYLRAKGHFEPAFVRFCGDYDLCRN